ncbi:MAG TPA: UDP-N-acetylglucosamine 1-carboxyvinyltransferase [Victivallales bacterium]|nr:UDP-N-acetylglucosamine 1-carboxyvinyltransferase [Victivallales bacterium]
MKSFLIEGSKTPLSGEITVNGNKNAVLPMIAATLLTDGKIILKNVPDIIDVDIMLKIAESLGTEIHKDKDKITLQTKSVTNTSLSKDFCTKIRTSLMFAGPLTARAGQASLWPPGGDVIGRRRLDGHFYGLRGLGAEIISENVPYQFKRKINLQGKDLFLDEASVTATEHIMMTAVLAKGQTIIRNAAAEPHVCDLGELLIKMGAKISGLTTNTITIDGVDKLHGTEHTIVGDHIEAASFLNLAAATGGGITINGTLPRHYWMTRRVFERFGVHFELQPNHIFMPPGQELEIKPDFGNSIPVISDGTWPQYPSDMMSCTIVMATQAKGTVMFFEKMFESRIYFVDRLIGMGAAAVVCDPHRVVISGPSPLRCSELSSPDIRSGMALLIAALCAKGKSVINNTHVISRGYENIVEKIQSIGGKITLIDQ